MVAASPGRRALTKGQRTRERLLHAAIERFGAQGYRTTSVSQLSRDAGLTPAAAYAYFADKDAFWVAAVEADLDALASEVREAALASDAPVYNLMTGLLAGLARHPLARRVLSEGDPDDLQLVLRHPLFAGTTQRIGQQLVVRQQAGLLPGGAEPAVMAVGIETVVFSLVVSAVRSGMVDDTERWAAVAHLLRTAVGGAPTDAEIPR